MPELTRLYWRLRWGGWKEYLVVIMAAAVATRADGTHTAVATAMVAATAQVVIMTRLGKDGGTSAACHGRRYLSEMHDGQCAGRTFLQSMRHVAGSSGMRKMQCCAGDRREVLQPVRQSGHWMTPAVKLALLTLPPLLAAGAGALVVSVKTPGARTTSVIQHFTGGIVFAAASWGYCSRTERTRRPQSSSAPYWACC